MILRYSVAMKILRWGWAAVLGLWAVGAWGQGILLPVSYAPVQGAPFTLTLIGDSDQGRLGPQEISRRILRDSQGRQRYEGADRQRYSSFRHGHRLRRGWRAG